MSTTYTHDLFGKEVYKKLPEEMRQMIRRHGNLYRIGLHGPDILFYYYCVCFNRVNQYGVAMHKEIARNFFERGLQKVRDDEDEALLVYLLGFANHYTLDSVIHPTVNRIVLEEGPSHAMQENEQDREFMIENGKNPLRYHPSDCIVPRGNYAETIHKAIPGVSAKKILVSLKLMKHTTNLLCYDDDGKKQMVILPILSMVGQKYTLGDQFMRRYAPKGISVYTQELRACYEEALKEAPGLLEEIYSMAKNKKTPIHLSERFDRTYNG